MNLLNVSLSATPTTSRRRPKSIPTSQEWRRYPTWSPSSSATPSTSSAMFLPTSQAFLLAPSSVRCTATLAVESDLEAGSQEFPSLLQLLAQQAGDDLTKRSEQLLPDRVGPDGQGDRPGCQGDCRKEEKARDGV